jgi:hypothetical protein
MSYHKLRIAWSVGWGIVCLLLIALWVRSYWWTDTIYYVQRPSHFLHLGSVPGAIFVLEDDVLIELSYGGRPRQTSWYTGRSADEPILFRDFWIFRAVLFGTLLVSRAVGSRARRCPWATLAIQPSHAANRHDAGGGGAGLDRLRVEKLTHRHYT